MALWGSLFIALKLAFAELPPLWVIFGRMALGSLVFLLAWRWRGQMHYRAGDWKYLLGLAACESCVYFLFEALALQHTSAAQAGMVTALLPLLVAVGAFIFLRERISRITLVGFLLALIGAVWLSLAGSADKHASNPILGNFYELLAMLCAMGYTLLLEHLSARYWPFLLTAMVAFVGTLFFLPLALLSAPLPTSVSPLGLGAVAYLGILVTVGGLWVVQLRCQPPAGQSGVGLYQFDPGVHLTVRHTPIGRKPEWHADAGCVSGVRWRVVKPVAGNAGGAGRCPRLRKG
jgi:drug/metabolite transporter (DMT)-like permease